MHALFGCSSRVDGADRVRAGGDEVLATDPVTGVTSGEPVVATITGTGVKDLVTITVTTESRRLSV